MLPVHLEHLVQGPYFATAPWGIPFTELDFLSAY
ncbi:hypothetical protein PAND9192_02626 [Photobacterium andalusiense]|uniref:Uncharacterized protein n=1 Tax=Photobacterium andalusiense TaxID=2204296 RepID=A0A1Y6MMB4_9GAMM|nr:hypothetical protein PAND9192_02626 [Photobacterium andalusiense]